LVFIFHFFSFLSHAILPIVIFFFFWKIIKDFETLSIDIKKKMSTFC
jgi:hypothetical protein